MSLNKLFCGLMAIAATTTISGIEALALYLPTGQGHRSTLYESQCTARLTAIESGSQINLREEPGTEYKSLGYGLVGDFVNIMTTTPPEVTHSEDGNGYLWRIVQFSKSGAKGWIRGDFLNMFCESIPD